MRAIKYFLNTKLTLKFWEWILICLLTSLPSIKFLTGIIEGLLN